MRTSPDTPTGLALDCRCDQWACTPPLSAQHFASVRRRLVLDCCKWDPQVGDVATLAGFALVLPAAVWRQLAGLAERLSAEALRAESELLLRPTLLAQLGLPSEVHRLLAEGTLPPTRAAARVLRFDFHPTLDGWRISEANSDVPGGYTEAGSFSRLMAEHFPELIPAGDPAARLAVALAEAAGQGGQIALLTAAGYMEDQQVTAYLAALLRPLGCTPHLAHPRQVHWRDGVAHLRTAWYRGRLDAVLRFYQGEWLGWLPAGTGWSAYVRGGQTPVCNPGTALIVESKRFPLVWNRLSAPLPAWKALLPEARDPRSAVWRHESGWLLKTAFCNTGDTVAIRELAGRWGWLWAAWQARLWPGDWVAQRCFEALPVPTPAGPMYPCLGVYTVNGKAVGIYGRLAPRPLIDFAAVDVAVLIQPEAGIREPDGWTGTSC